MLTVLFCIIAVYVIGYLIAVYISKKHNIKQGLSNEDASENAIAISFIWPLMLFLLFFVGFEKSICFICELCYKPLEKFISKFEQIVRKW